MAVLQGSLLDLADDIEVRALGDTVRRTVLGDGAWVDQRPAWVGGADELYEALRRDVPWYAERRQMYDSIVDVPRLLSFYGEADPLPHLALDECRDALSAHYADELGEPFVTAGLCLYRDGQDSVAWHGDRIGRSRDTDTMVAHPLRRRPPRPRAAAPGRRGLGPRPGRPRRPRRHGRVVPAHVGPLHPQDRQARRPADQHPVPGARRPLTAPVARRRLSAGSPRRRGSRPRGSRAGRCTARAPRRRRTRRARA